MDVLKPKWYNGFDPTGWWMSEKHDGVRGEWNQEGPEFISKGDKHYYVPQQMVKEMNAVEALPRLSGEFWLGRGQFQKTVSIVRNQREDIHEWHTLVYMIFELPVDTLLFEERQDYLQEIGWQLPPWVHIIPWTLCESMDHLIAFYNAILSMTGEGIVLSRPESEYVFGRSSNQFKLTPTFTTEALVTGYTEGKGKHVGRTGALIVENTKMGEFKVGTGLDNAEREDPPPFNSVITFSYKGLTSAGKPRHPAYIGVRDYE